MSNRGGGANQRGRPPSYLYSSFVIRHSSLPQCGMLRNWRLWLGLAISVVFIALAVRGQNLGQVRRALGEADYRYLPFALVLYFAGVGVRALRWQALLAPVRRLSARTLFPVVVIGYMANNILPWRIGEFVRA